MAISKHIQELESYYKTPLFDRLGNKISLTSAGKTLLELSERIMENYRQLDYEMKILQNEYSGGLRLGASTTIAQYVLPPLLAKFTDKFPQIALSLLNGNSREIESALQKHLIDIGLVEGNLRLPNLKYIPFIQDELVAVVHSRSKLAKKDEIALEELKKMPLVLREGGSGTLDVIKASLSNKNIKLSDLNIRMYLGSTESIKLFLENTECMGIVSIRSISRELASGQFKVIDIDSLEMPREFSFVLLHGTESGLTQHFMQFVLHYNNML